LRGDGEGEEFPLNFVGLSENSYNFQIWYEKKPWQARLKYSYRDSFLVSESIDIANGQPLYTDDWGTLNGSISYAINRTFTVTLQGVNLTNERKVQPAVFDSGPIARMMDADRRISLGIRGRF
jgi:outer membrane receptor protein involved in Fe transport